MSGGPEFQLAERPCVEALVGMGYMYLPPAEAKARVAVDAARLVAGDNESTRDGRNQVLLRDEVIAAIMRLNDLDEEDARAAYGELLGQTDNESWLGLLRGDWDRKVKGQATSKTIRLIDFTDPARNRFVVTNQLYVQSQSSRIPDVVVYVNGIPVVVLEAKRPLSYQDKTGEAFDQIKQYERDVPKLFVSNVFNMVTNGTYVMYGATHAASAYWAQWRDPWPRKRGDFGSDLERGLWCLLEPSRLLDLIAHFVVFEQDDKTQKTVKKMCRYQQYRAVNKIVDRIVAGEHRRGLVWHTQGSGKSLTMVFAALKVKTHRTIEHESLNSVNLLVLTDRIDLDSQISGTFKACKLANPQSVRSIRKLRKVLHSGINGQTVLSTIFMLEGSKEPVANSGRWIVMVDECHRTQEKDLGAYLRATLPDAWFFGFTGTPIKKSDKNTYVNFGVVGEGYLDKYGIDDAVADGATVPIKYTSRKAEWQVDPAKLDVLFDHWFATEAEERREAIKKRGLSVADLAKHGERIRLIAYDIWTHFSTHARPDGFKAQLVAIDREAVILYKRALDEVIAAALEADGMSPEEAQATAAALSVPIYSSGQEDGKPSEDPWKESVREDLLRYALDDKGEVTAKQAFKRRGEPPEFLIVCNKLLTGFDAPVESVMYLDNPLKEHNLLQAIARTNRVEGDKKQYGLIVDYIGVTRSLDEALSTYRQEDVEHALVDLDELRAELVTAHRDTIRLMDGLARHTGDLRAEYDAFITMLGSEDAWLSFYRVAAYFVRVYEALSPDPSILDYTADLKWVVGFFHVARPHFEQDPFEGIKSYSARIRKMLQEHLHVTGLDTVCKLRAITDPEFWQDFETEGKSERQLKEAAIRKVTELKRILRQRMEANELRYGPFSRRLLELIRRLEAGLDDVAEIVSDAEALSHDVADEDQAHAGSGLAERPYNIYMILKAILAADAEDDESEESDDDEETTTGPGSDRNGGGSKTLDLTVKLAEDIHALYESDESAPPGWHLKDQLRKELRQQVRRMLSKAKIPDLLATSNLIEDYAIKHYLKLI